MVTQPTPGQSIPMLDYSFREEIFPNIQPEPALVQLKAIASHPIARYVGEEADPHPATISYQGVVESNKVSPDSSLLQIKKLQFPQPLLIRLVLQTPHQLCCPSLNTHQGLVRDPKLNTVLKVWPHR